MSQRKWTAAECFRKPETPTLAVPELENDRTVYIMSRLNVVKLINGGFCHMSLYHTDYHTYELTVAVYLMH